MKEFWSKKHRENDLLHLSGNGEVTLDVLHCRDQFSRADRILNIGVGMGLFEAYCQDQGKEIDSVDIAPEALTKVPGLTFLDPDFPTGSYDLITELLVAQHVNDATLERHIKGAVGALANGGLYALQSPAFIRPCDVSTAQPGPGVMESGSVCRSIAWIDTMVRLNGGQITNIFWRGNFPEYNSAWYIYHIRRMSA